ncbi:MAG TPA: flagellar motor protein MotB [Acidobacteriaceae bacterium]|nr:flagellar motor protein MotB [Acidobacteriaceae bacterium]
MADEQPIIVIKKKGGHGGHHGGAWKVAYADFVTAMMSLFIVLWLMNSSKPVQEAVAGYFRDPLGTAKKTGTAMGGAGEAAPVKKEDMAKLKQDLMKAIENLPDFNKLKKQIELTITPEGLQIELMESPQGTFFENGKAQPTEIMQNLLKVLSGQIGKLPNPLTIEGHTDSKPFSDSPLYGNWELSTDRANAARRLMEDSGLRPNQVIQVRGYADQKLRKPQQPEDPSNRRVTLIVQYLKPPAGPPSIVSDGSLPTAKQLNPEAVPTPKEPASNPKEAKPGK